MNINTTYTSVVSYSQQNIQNKMASKDKDQTVIQSTNDFVSEKDKMMKILDENTKKSTNKINNLKILIAI